MNRYAVVQTKFESIDSEVLRKVLVEEGGFVPVDAARVARKVRGVLAERLSFQQAAAVCQSLTAHGFSVRSLPATSLAPEEKAKVVRWFDMDESEIRLPWGYHGQVNKIPWPSVFVISAGQVSEIKEHQTENVDRYASSRTGIVVERETHRHSERIDVTELICVAESGAFLHVRFPYHEMNYGRILGEQVAGTLFDRYLVMLDILVSRSTSALVSPETTRLLQERKQHYDSSEGDFAQFAEEKEFAAYNRWLLQLVLMSEGFHSSQTAGENDT